VTGNRSPKNSTTKTVATIPEFGPRKRAGVVRTGSVIAILLGFLDHFEISHHGHVFVFEVVAVKNIAASRCSEWDEKLDSLVGSMRLCLSN
jgi:hypothetical protein